MKLARSVIVQPTTVRFAARFLSSVASVAVLVLSTGCAGAIASVEQIGAEAEGIYKIEEGRFCTADAARAAARQASCSRLSVITAVKDAGIDPLSGGS